MTEVITDDGKVDAALKVLAENNNTTYNLRRLYRDLRKNAPNAKILVVGYPRFFPTTPPGLCNTRGPGPELTRADMSWINSKIAKANGVIASAAVATGVTFVDVANAFSGHELCTKSPWMNRVFDSLTSWIAAQSFHPNIDGFAALAKVVESYV